MPKWTKRQGYDTDSKFEEKLKNGIFKDLEYHPEKIAYVMYHTYEPDWVFEEEVENDRGEQYVFKTYIEAKGAFREASEMAKYVAVDKTLDHDREELVFLFMKPDAPIYFRAKRKDGSRMSHADWCIKNKFRYFSEKTIHELIG